MKITRRFLLAFLLLSPLGVSSLGDPAPNRTYTVLIGTYTDKTDSKGIYAFDFDTQTGKLSPKGLAAETPNPSWVAVHPNGKWVYAANEIGKQSAISAFSVDPSSGKLALLNQLPSEGEDPCYLSFDKTGKYLFVANYTSGTVAVFPILDNGKLGAPTSVVKDAGTLGPDKKRQDGPHAHWIVANGDFVYVADLGLDRVFVYHFNDGKGSLQPAILGPQGFSKELSAKLSSGTGPRHVAFRSNRMYILGELKSTVTLTVYDPSDFSYHSQQTISTLPKGFSGRNDAAEIVVHDSRKWLFASNRGHDSIAVFAIDPQKGTLTPTGDFPTGGKEPRHFALDPTGQFLLAENQYSNNIVVFRIDPATGALTQISKTENIPSPVCLIFLP